MAYTQSCTTKGKPDRERSGLYAKKDGSSAKHLRRPKQAAGVDNFTVVNLRSTTVAAVLADVGQYAFTQSVNGTSMRSVQSGVTEGDGQDQTIGGSLGAANALWYLVLSSHAESPNVSIISRLDRSACRQSEALQSPAGQDSFLASDIAVDANTGKLYLATPLGIIEHQFMPANQC